MHREDLVFTLLYTAGAVALFISATILHRRWPGRMAIRAAIVMMAMDCVWLSGGIFELALPGTWAKWLAAHLQLGAMMAVSSAWFVWVLLYTRQGRRLTQAAIYVLLWIHVVVMMAVVTNSHHHLVWNRLIYDLNGDLIRFYGPGYWAIWWFLYGMFAVGITLLAGKFMQAKRLYRWEVSLLMLASVVPWFLGLMDALEEFRRHQMQGTLTAISVSGLLSAWLLFRLRSRHLMPVARQAILDNLADAVMVIDRWGTMIDANPAARGLFGIGPTAPMNRPLRRYWPDMPPLSHLRDAPEGPMAEVRIANDPMERVLDFKFSCIRDRAGRLISYVIVLRDITDRKHAECDRDRYQEELQYARRLESLAMFAGGMAHEFNNAFTRMLGHTSLALESVPAGAPVIQHLYAVERTVARASELAAQILAYSGQGHFLVHPVNMSQLLLDCRHVVDSLVIEDAELEWCLEPAVPDVEADSMQLRLLVTHLATNASEALGATAKRITIATGTMTCTQHDLRCAAYYHPEAKAGTYAYVEVADTGCGMDRSTQRRIFDPFFTTKMTGRGLGLAAVLGIVRGHRGCIFIESESGIGTAVRACFPTAAVAASHFPEAAMLPPLVLAR